MSCAALLRDDPAWFDGGTAEPPVRVHRPYRDLPAAPAPVLRFARGEPAPSRILLAEDDDAMRELIVEALREEGYQVIEVCNGRQLAKCLAGTSDVHYPRPDLVITDVRMPGPSGLDVLAAIRQADWEMPVMVITAFGSPETHAEARRLGAQILDKPFDVDDLVHAVCSTVPVTV